MLVNGAVGDGCFADLGSGFGLHGMTVEKTEQTGKNDDYKCFFLHNGLQNYKKIRNYAKKSAKNFVNSKKSSNFARFFRSSEVAHDDFVAPQLM